MDEDKMEISLIDFMNLKELRSCPSCRKQVTISEKKCIHCGATWAIYERLLHIRPKIKWAARHLTALDAEIQASFFQADSFKIDAERDPTTQKIIHRLTKMPLVSETIPAMAGDVLQSLRSALDHLAYQLFRQHSGETASPKHIYFPIFETEEGYETKKKGKVNGIHPQVIREFDKLKLYKGGNDLLWRLHTLNNIDKHRTLITGGAAVERIDIGPSAADHFKGKMEIFPLASKDLRARVDSYVKPPYKKFPLKEGDILLSDGPEPERNEPPPILYNFQLCFNEPEADLVGEDLLNTLHAMFYEVNNLVSSFGKFLMY